MFSKMELKRAVDFAAIPLRISEVFRALNIPQNEWTVIMALLSEENRPISESSLAAIAGIRRTTIRPYVKEGINLGMVERTDDGLRHTPLGRQTVVALLTEIEAIVFDGKHGFSPYLAEILVKSQQAAQLKDPADYDTLVSLYFKPIRKQRPLSKSDRYKVAS